MPINPTPAPPARQPNPLMPQGVSPQPGLGQPPGNPIDTLATQHDMSSAQLKKLDSMADLMGKTRKELDSLAGLGDLVEEEDVIRAVGKIVAAGGSPMPLASMLADAPFGNREALQAWVATKDASIRQIEQQLRAAQQQARHAVGVAGLRLLAGHAVQGATQQAAPQPDAQPEPAAGNPLQPGGS